VGAGTSNGGAEAVWRLADTFGIGRGQTADGSGLSAHDRERPWHEVAWLVAMAGTPVADQLRYSLPLACGDGTLQQRMCGTRAAGNVFAKTGTLNGVTALSGYAVTRSGRRVFFAFQLAGVGNLAAGRDAIDRAVVALVTMDD
jgi:D-alanyl-D-alanine carboxypeptidase/D-alanyl-D-alanine-endopeptidase (penicillin-binding protein 4)